MFEQSTLFGQTRPSKHLPGHLARTNATQTAVVCFDDKAISVTIKILKHTCNAMKIDGSEKPKQQLFKTWIV